MLKRIFLFTLFVPFALLCGNAPTEKELATRHRLITLLTAQTLEHSHYSQKKLDGAMSSRIFDGYFELLDGNKIFFTREDVARFEPQRYQLSRQLLRGDSAFAFSVYKVYQKRVAEYRAFAERKIKEGLSFNGSDFYVPDRRKLPRCKNDAELQKVWLEKIKNDVLYFRLFQRAVKLEKSKEKKEGEAETPVNRFWERKSPEEKVLTRLKDWNNVVAKKEPGEILGDYLCAACFAYGPHSGYLSPQSEEDFDIHMKLSLTGIGATLISEDGYIRVVEIVPGGPAAKQGKLKVEDRILAVAQEGKEPVDLTDMPVERAVKLIRGPVGSKVNLTVLSGEKVNAVPHEITIVRGKVELKESEASGTVREIPCGDGKNRRIGIIDLPSFYMDFDAYLRDDPNAKCCSRDVKKILADFQKQKVDAVVMDLRRNGGGSLPDAIRLAGLFIKEGPVVQIRTRDRKIIPQCDEDGGLVAYDGPMVVLISKFSASASEIFSGAMKDYNRALIVGDSRSFGKGTVLEVAPLDQMLSFFTRKFPAGSVTYESHVFYRVSGGSVQQMGIKPDIQLPSFSESMEVGEMFSKNHLPWDAVSATNYTPAAPKLSPAETVRLRNASQERVNHSPEFRRIMERAKQFEQNRKRNRLSLNEEQRWQDYLREKSLEEERDAQESEGKSSRKKQQKDPVLEEAAYIAGDLATAGK